jgi:adenylyl-sulfate kinase
MDNLRQEKYMVKPIQRSELKQQQPLLIWFTGLSGSGKSTLAKKLELELYNRRYHTFSMDGDNVRSGLNNNIGFTPEGRKENLRRIGEVSKLMLDAGLIVIGAFISPYSEDRYAIQNTVGMNNYFEVFVDTPLEVCEERDVKGLYAKARKGEIKNFTGISAPYEKPEEPTVRIDTSKTSIEEALEILVSKIEERIKIDK